MARATPVPVPVLPIIGREGDIETVLHLLDRSRSVTLLGPGGVGKTRLAVEVALRWSSARSLPAYFVDLTKVDDPASVPILIAQVGLHRTSATDAMQLLDEAFRGATMLVVLDNFEHVVDAGQIVGRMVRWSPGAHVLSTSRARLQISDEQVVDIAPLEVEPDPASRPGVYSYSDAVAFFEQVALGVDGRFALADHLTDVSEICRTLEGLPLAIKLAAGHVRTLPPGLLRARLSARLASASGSARDTPARQQTIQATIDWSLQLLGDAERLLFTRLGVFAAPFALEAVEEVCGEPGFDVVDARARLVDQSLVHRMRGPRGESRFRMLELLHQRADELLSREEEQRVRRLDATYVVDLLETLDEQRWEKPRRLMDRPAHRRLAGDPAGPRLGDNPWRAPARGPHHCLPGHLLAPRGTPQGGPTMGLRRPRAHRRPRSLTDRAAAPRGGLPRVAA